MLAYLIVPAPADSAHGGLSTGADNVATILVVLAVVALASFKRRRGQAMSQARRRLMYTLPIGRAVDRRGGGDPKLHPNDPGQDAADDRGPVG